MDNIVKKTGYNVQGVRDIVFIDIDNVVSMPEVSGSPNYVVDISAMVFTTELNYATHTRFSGKFTEEEIEKDGKLIHRQVVSFFVPKHTSLRWKSFSEMEHHEFLVAVRDHNNKSRFCGFINLQGEKRGMTFTANQSTERVNGYDCRFTLDAPHRALPCILIGELGIVVDPILPDDGDEVIIDLPS